MEIPQIEETRLSAGLDETRARPEIKTCEPEEKKCIYNKEMSCQAPDCKMEICSKCPYGYQFSLAYTVSDVFKKIVSIAIFLAKSDDVLRDVIALIGKGKEELGELGVGEEEEGREGKEEKKVKDAREVKREESIEEVKPEIKKVDINDIKNKTLKEASSAIGGMSDLIAAKVTLIDDALGPPISSGQTNPDGPRARPLV
jgi:hypothetical protein